MSSLPTTGGQDRPKSACFEKACRDSLSVNRSFLTPYCTDLYICDESTVTLYHIYHTEPDITNSSSSCHSCMLGTVIVTSEHERVVSAIFLWAGSYDRSFPPKAAIPCCAQDGCRSHVAQGPFSNKSKVVLSRLSQGCFSLLLYYRRSVRQQPRGVCCLKLPAATVAMDSVLEAFNGWA